MLDQNKFLSLVAICLGAATIASLWSATYIALPHIQASLHASDLQTQWIVNIYGIFITCGLVTFGRLADRFGHRRLYLIGLILAFIALLALSMAASAAQVIIFQAVIGIAGSIILPVSQALITNIYPQHERARAIGIWGFAVGLALGLGPIIGGALVSMGSWRTVFYVGAIIPLASIILLLLFCPQSKPSLEPVKLDIKGAVWLAITVALFVVGVDDLSVLASWQDALIFCLSFISLISLIVIERKASAPILCPRLWANRQFLIATVTNFCMLFVVWALFYLLPYYLQTQLHFMPVQSGALMLGVTLPLSLFSAFMGFLMKKLRINLLIAVGFFIMLFSFYLQLQFGVSTYWLFVLLALITFGIGWGFVWTPSITLAIATLGPEDAGLASGSIVTIQELGGTIGLAVVATTVRYHSSFITGMDVSLIVLIFIGLIGLLAALFAPGNID